MHTVKDVHVHLIQCTVLLLMCNALHALWVLQTTEHPRQDQPCMPVCGAKVDLCKSVWKKV